MADVLANSMACRPGATCDFAGYAYRKSATWWINYMYHDPKATCHIAGCSHCHLAKSLSSSCHIDIAGCKLFAILKIVFCHIFLCFLNTVWTFTSGGFCIVSDCLPRVSTLMRDMICLSVRRSVRHVSVWIRLNVLS